MLITKLKIKHHEVTVHCREEMGVGLDVGVSW